MQVWVEVIGWSQTVVTRSHHIISVYLPEHCNHDKKLNIRWAILQLTHVYTFNHQLNCLLFLIFCSTGTEEANDDLPETLHDCSIKVCRVQRSLTCNFS